MEELSTFSNGISFYTSERFRYDPKRSYFNKRSVGRFNKKSISVLTTFLETWFGWLLVK